MGHGITGCGTLRFYRKNEIQPFHDLSRQTVSRFGSRHFTSVLFFFWVLGVGFLSSGCTEKGPSTAPQKKVLPTEAKQSRAIASQSGSQRKSELQTDGQQKMPASATKTGQKNGKIAPPLNTSENNASRGKPPTENLTDPQRLKELGFDLFKSHHLLLISDSVQPQEQKTFEELPVIVDQLTNRFFTDYPGTPGGVHLTGCLMRDRSLYLQASLLAEDFAYLEHGAHRGRRFWLNEQKTDYYRRHLMIHEAVHCLTDLKPHGWPVWYLEGIAEYYAIHEFKPNQTTKFGVFPGNEQIAGGFGRLELLRDEIAAGRFRTISRIRQLNSNNFYPHKTSYGWSWALCYFLATHPDTDEEFRELGRFRQAAAFNQFFEHAFSVDNTKLNAQWAVFVSSLVPDYDMERGSISWTRTGDTQSEKGVVIQADRNWQGSGIHVEKGKEYVIRASGRFTVAQKPVPWECEPQGVSIDYVDGQPLGQVQAVLFHPDQPGKNNDSGFLQIVPVGRQTTFLPEQKGELFFRINDRGSSWGDNSGSVTVSVQESSVSK